MYIDSEHENFKYLVEPHDNFLILSSSRRISGSSGDLDSVPVYIQYFNPSELSFESTYYSYDSFDFTDISSTFTQDLEDRPDFPFLLFSSFIFIIAIIWVFNQLSKFFTKGGVFGHFS